MTSAPLNPLEVPPYLVQPLIESIPGGSSSTRITCAQALGSELYIGCSNGELLRYALQADDPTKLESYSLQSRQTLMAEKPVDEIVIVPCISRALILSDHQVHLYTIPSLDPVANTKPLRNVITFAVDQQHLQRPAPLPSDPPSKADQVEFCAIKRNNIQLYVIRDRVIFQKEIPLPDGATVARRTGRYLCAADKAYYNIIDLEVASILPVMPVSQAPDDSHPVKPFITVISENEFLILSWTGASTLGVYITGDGDPVRGTLEWPGHPEAVCLDYPYITTLMQTGTIEIHNVETQTIAQVISAPDLGTQDAKGDMLRTSLKACLGGYMVPSSQRTDKMRMKSVRLVRNPPEKPSEFSPEPEKVEGYAVEDSQIEPQEI